jgi:benzoyl-CoA reductase subunit D
MSWPRQGAGESLLTGGLDIGARSVKIAILSHQETGPVVLAKFLLRIQGSCDPLAERVAIRESWHRVLADSGLSAGDIDYVASTGTPDRQLVQVGRHNERSSHAFGARLLFPDATAALDIGANQIRCALLSEVPVGLRYASIRLEPGCGSETWDAIARRSGATSDEATPMANTTLPDDLATSALTLARRLAVEGKIALTGGMVRDADFVRSLWNRLLESESSVSLLVSPEAVFAGAYGAAILAARRFSRISRTLVLTADPLAQRSLSIGRHTLN